MTSTATILARARAGRHCGLRSFAIHNAPARGWQVVAVES